MECSYCKCAKEVKDIYNNIHLVCTHNSSRHFMTEVDDLGKCSYGYGFCETCKWYKHYNVGYICTNEEAYDYINCDITGGCDKWEESE